MIKVQTSITCLYPAANTKHIFKGLLSLKFILFPWVPLDTREIGTWIVCHWTRLFFVFPLLPSNSFWGFYFIYKILQILKLQGNVSVTCFEEFDLMYLYKRGYFLCVFSPHIFKTSKKHGSWDLWICLSSLLRIMDE